MEVIFQHPNVTVSFNEEKGYLRLDWRENPPIDVYKEALMSCLPIIEAHQLHDFLIDQSALNFVGSEAQAWLSVVWFGKLDKILKKDIHFAIIASKKLFVTLASKVVAKRIDNSHKNYTIQYFDDENIALDWLTSTIKANI